MSWPWAGTGGTRPGSKSSQWTQLPKSDWSILAREMEEMYWDAVEREMVYVIRTLRLWFQSDDDDNGKNLLEGQRGQNKASYDSRTLRSFVSQVSSTGREIAEMEELYVQGATSRDPQQSKEQNDRTRLNSLKKTLDRVIGKITTKLDNRVSQNEWDHEQARLILQGLGYLDIDKFIEHRPEVAWWSETRHAQLNWSYSPDLPFSSSPQAVPIFGAAVCDSCKKTIRGPSYVCIHGCRSDVRDRTKNLPFRVCERCRLHQRIYCPEGHEMVMRKQYKHCILRDMMTKERSDLLCTCTLSPDKRCTEDFNGFPVEISDRHADRCGLLGLRERVNQARREHISNRPSSLRQTFRKDSAGNNTKDQKRPSRAFRRGSKGNRSTSSLPPVSTDPANIEARPLLPGSGTSTPLESKPESPRRASSGSREVSKRYPFGNVHASLMVGPLMIENGAKIRLDGVIISVRDPPQLSTIEARTYGESIDATRTLALNEEQMISRGRTPQNEKRDFRRVKSCMKQVVGGLFSGLTFEHEISDTKRSQSSRQKKPVGGRIGKAPARPLGRGVGEHKSKVEETPEIHGGEANGEADLIRTEESDVVDILVEKARRFQYSHLRKRNNEPRLRDAAAEVTKVLRRLIEARVREYLNIIAKRLFHEDLPLTLDFLFNNCQNFCENLLDKTHFRNFVPFSDPEKKKPPLFAMSFVLPPKSYEKVDVTSKWDVPLGLTEEYLLDHQFKRYNESDILDTMHEYWHDWGGFGAHLYPFQDLFPWDCTEAYRENSATCNTCTLAKHVWSFPLDAFSLTKFYLWRSVSRYPPANLDAPQAFNEDSSTDPSLAQLSPEAWRRNRLLVLLAHDKLVKVAVAMAKTPKFVEICTDPTKKIGPEWMRRKLGGIHRAQPYSNYFYRENTDEVAEWVHLSRDSQIRIYESLREGKTKARDVGLWNNDSLRGLNASEAEVAEKSRAASEAYKNTVAVQTVFARGQEIEEEAIEEGSSPPTPRFHSIDNTPISPPTPSRPSLPQRSSLGDSYLKSAYLTSNQAPYFDWRGVVTLLGLGVGAAIFRASRGQV